MCVAQLMCNLLVTDAAKREQWETVFGMEPESGTRAAKRDIKARNEQRKSLKECFRRLELAHVPAVSQDPRSGQVPPDQQANLQRALDAMLKDIAGTELSARTGAGHLMGDPSLPCVPSSVIPAIKALAEQANASLDLGTINGASLREQLQTHATGVAV